MSSMQNTTKKVDVVIPVYKPGEQLSELLNKLLTQTNSVNRIILINTEKDYFDDKLFTEEVVEGQKVVKVFCHEKKVLADFEEINENLRQNVTKANTCSNILMPISASSSLIERLRLG